MSDLAHSFIIGIDGGASKTRAVIASLDGAVAIARRVRGSAIVGHPHPEAIDVLTSVVHDLLDAAGAMASDVRAMVLGLSGIDYRDEYDAQFGALARGLGMDAARLTLVNDSVIALAGATQAPRATIVQHGTEVTMAYRAAVGAEEVFDSLGVADCFDMRLRAVPLVARMIDGRAPATPLLDAVLTHLGVTAEQFSGFVLREKAAAKRAVLTLAPIVAAHWQTGDPAAGALVESAINDYVLATKAMARRMGPGTFTACFGGGTIQAGGEALFAAIADRLNAAGLDAQVAAPTYAPEIGACLMALHALGAPPDAILRRLSANGLEYA